MCVERPSAVYSVSVLPLYIASNFHPLEVVDRGSDPQLQVGENLNICVSNFSVLFSTD